MSLFFCFTDTVAIIKRTLDILDKKEIIQKSYKFGTNEGEFISFLGELFFQYFALLS